MSQRVHQGHWVIALAAFAALEWGGGGRGWGSCLILWGREPHLTHEAGSGPDTQGPLPHFHSFNTCIHFPGSLHWKFPPAQPSPAQPHPLPTEALPTEAQLTLGCATGQGSWGQYTCLVQWGP